VRPTNQRSPEGEHTNLTRNLNLNKFI